MLCDYSCQITTVCQIRINLSRAKENKNKRVKFRVKHEREKEIRKNTTQQEGMLFYLGCVWPSQWWPRARGQPGHTAWWEPWCHSLAWSGQAWRRSFLARPPTGETLSLWLKIEEGAVGCWQKEEVRGWKSSKDHKDVQYWSLWQYDELREMVVLL